MSKVLVVDDEPDVLELMKVTLEGTGHTVLLALDGQMALDLADRHRPDVAVVDVMMPEMDGYELCQKLRDNSRVGSIPILVLTARESDDAADIALKAGATGFLTKPFQPDALCEAVRRLSTSGDPSAALPHDFGAIVKTLSARLERPAQSGGALALIEAPVQAAASRPTALSAALLELFPNGVDDMLRQMVERGGSDLHVKAGSPPGIRLHGELSPLEAPALAAADTEALLFRLMGAEQRQSFLSENELDFAYSIAGLSRFRVNVMRQRGSVAGVIRMIPLRVKTLDELAMPASLKELASRPRGLVLVTGPTGSGKSTTLAAMVHHINETRRCHILTLEDPIEFVHADRMSFVNQREIGQDSKSFSAALKRALRQDPDVIYVGEMRDLETIAAAVTAAETGHLVFGTLHTTGAAPTVDRIIDVFPAEQQAQIRLQLSVGLEGVVSQVLVPRADGRGRAVALEVLLGVPAVRNLIREGKTHQIASVMQSGGAQGMLTMNASLRDLVRRGSISLGAALAVSPDPSELRGMVAGG